MTGQRQATLARLWLRQLASLVSGNGWRAAHERNGGDNLAICMQSGGFKLWLRTTNAGTRWMANVEGVPGSARMQTGGKVALTVSGLEDAQRLVLERCVKPLR